jgi:hypothetical protein
MSRRTKWFGVWKRLKRARREAARGRRFDRWLAFEQCEPRVVLSTNVGSGLVAATTLQPNEGGLIEFQTALSLDMVSVNSDLLSSANAAAPGMNRGALLVTGDYQGTKSQEFTLSDFDGAWEPFNVRLIEPPSAAAEHAEGGRIALLDPRATGTPGVVGLTMGRSEASVAAQSLSSPVSKNNFETNRAIDSHNLRGRAMALEVAAGGDASSPTEALDDSIADLAMGKNLKISLDAEGSNRDATTTGGDEAKPVAVTSRRAIASRQRAAEEQLRTDAGKLFSSPDTRHRQSGPTEAIVADDEPRGDLQAPSRAAAHDAALGLLAAAQEDAEQAEKARAGVPIELRSRRVLAIALVLMLGSAPMSKSLRRRAADKSADQRPPRRES